jgi:hypothetical protein
MGLRQFVPLSFLLVLSGAVMAAGLFGHCGATGFVWWMNEEVASPLRGILHLTEAAPIGPFQVAVMILAMAGIVAILGHHERFSFLANYLVLVALVYAVLFDWIDGRANVPDVSLMLAVIVAVISTIYGHRQFLSAQLGQPSAA